jgi:phosphoadenosine phosphosulfate reductase
VAIATEVLPHADWRPPGPDEVRDLNRELEEREPLEILVWAAAHVPLQRLILSTAFGMGGVVLIHLLREAGVRIPVVFVDTLHHFPETLHLAQEVRDHYALDLRVQRPAPDRQAFEAIHGERLWERDVERFHRLTKVEPMARALSDVAGWITARRRDQSRDRAGLPVVEGGRRLKINPLARWPARRVQTFVRQHGLPYNPLHDRGYASVGDQPLTTPVGPGEAERAGRWRGSDRTECGLHFL